MKTIKLTKGYEALVDDDDYDWLIQWSWFVLKGRNIYARRGITKSGKKFEFKMHSEIMKHHGMVGFVDHIDRNGLNNQKSNLRIATRSQNASNRKSYGTSEFLGVSWTKSHNRWHAQISKNGKNKHLGFFRDEREAARRYNEEAIILHGEFANLNNV